MGIEKILGKETIRKIKNGELRKIDIDGENLREHSLSDEDVKIIVDFLNDISDNKIVEISLPRNKITDKGAKYLSSLPHLESLNLAGNQLTDDCCCCFVNIKTLSTLILDGNEKISDISPILTLHNLHGLYANNCSISINEETKKMLASSSLKNIDLDFNPVDDETVQDIYLILKNKEENVINLEPSCTVTPLIYQFSLSKKDNLLCSDLEQHEKSSSDNYEDLTFAYKLK